MKSRHAILLLTVWALLLAPFLCGTGLLTHACADEADSGCHHELDCDTDPCQVLALKAVQTGGRNDDASVDTLSPVAPAPLGTHTEPDRLLEVVPPLRRLPDMAAHGRSLPLTC